MINYSIQIQLIKSEFLKKGVINEKAARLFRFLYWANCLLLFTGETIRLVVSNHALKCPLLVI